MMAAILTNIVSHLRFLNHETNCGLEGDGTAWKPDGLAAESLGTDGFDGQFFASYPTAVSWGENRLDIFGILSNATLLHKYWDGNAWQPSATGWESWGDDFFDQPVATSWGENRLDVWAVREDGQLAHRYCKL